jgi:hypothetical protein
MWRRARSGSSSGSTEEELPMQWDRLPAETAKAYAAFSAYLALGPDRSIDRAFEQRQNSSKTAARSRWWMEWSRQHGWVARAAAFDQHELQEKVAARVEVRERIRQSAIDNAAMALSEIVSLCRFEDDDKPSFAAKVRLAAAAQLLSLAGVDAPKRHELSGPGGGPVALDPVAVAQRVDEILSGLNEEQMARLEGELDP